MPDLGSANTIGAGPNRVYPILMVVARGHDALIAFQERFFEDTAWPCRNPIATYQECSPGPLENTICLDAILERIMNHLDSAFVDELQSTFSRPIGGRNDSRWTARIHLERPLRDIEMVRAHVRQCTTRVLLIRPP